MLKGVDLIERLEVELHREAAWASMTNTALIFIYVQNKA
jgi:hypothetical protein